MRRRASARRRQPAGITEPRSGMRREATVDVTAPGAALSSRSYQFVLVIAALLGGARGTVHADARAMFRIGVEPLGLDPSEDTPYVGEHVNDAVTAYNAASAAYNRAHGFSPG